MMESVNVECQLLTTYNLPQFFSEPPSSRHPGQSAAWRGEKKNPPKTNVIIHVECDSWTMATTDSCFLTLYRISITYFDLRTGVVTPHIETA